MKSKLKDLTDEDKTRKKMLLNTFDSVDIDGLNNTVDPYEICRILGRNIDVPVIYFSEGATKELSILHKSKTNVLFNIIPNKNISVRAKINMDFDGINKNLFLYASILKQKTETTYKYFYTDVEFEIYSYSNGSLYKQVLNFDNVIGKSIDDYNATWILLKLYNFIVSDEFKKKLKDKSNRVLSSMKRDGIVNSEFNDNLVLLYCFLIITEDNNFKMNIDEKNMSFLADKYNYLFIQKYVRDVLKEKPY